MAAADLLVTASGTATAEAALLGTPMIVVYRMHPVTWELARRLVKVRHIAMANLLAGRRLVPELLQGEVKWRAMAEVTTGCWAIPGCCARHVKASARPRHRLDSGGAPGRAAAAILEEIRQR